MSYPPDPETSLSPNVVRGAERGVELLALWRGHWDLHHPHDPVLGEDASRSRKGAAGLRHAKVWRFARCDQSAASQWTPFATLCAPFLH